MERPTPRAMQAEDSMCDIPTPECTKHSRKRKESEGENTLLEKVGRRGHQGWRAGLGLSWWNCDTTTEPYRGGTWRTLRKGSMGWPFWGFLIISHSNSLDTSEKNYFIGSRCCNIRRKALKRIGTKQVPQSPAKGISSVRPSKGICHATFQYLCYSSGILSPQKQALMGSPWVTCSFSATRQHTWTDSLNRERRPPQRKITKSLGWHFQRSGKGFWTRTHKNQAPTADSERKAGASLRTNWIFLWFCLGKQCQAVSCQGHEPYRRFGRQK